MGVRILGVSVITLAIWSLLNFFDAPTSRTGIVASFFCGLYLISHGYIIPFIPFLLCAVFLFTPGENRTVLNRFHAGIMLFFQKWVWVFPLLFIPFYLKPVAHALLKRSQLGFSYLITCPVLWVMLVFVLFLLLLFSMVAGILFRRVSTERSLLFIAGGACYLAPLVFGAPPGITVVTRVHC